MKITIPSKHLHSALNLLKPIAGRKTTLPVLGNVLIETGEQLVALTVTDTDQRLSIKVPCAVNKPGSITLPAARLSSIVASYSGGEITIEVDANHVATIRQGRAMDKMHGLSADEFPTDAPVEKADEISIDGAELKRLISKAQLHCATDNAKAQLKTVVLRSREGALSVESTDGRRMCLIDSGIETATKETPIIPIESASGLCSFDGSCKMEISDAVVRVSSAMQSFSTKVISGSPNDYKRYVPAKDTTPKKATFDKAELLAAIEGAQVFAGLESPRVILDCDGSDLSISSVTAQIGESSRQISTKGPGDEFKIAMNPAFLRDALKTCDEETVTLNLGDAKTPVVIREGGITIVLMPMIIQ